MTNKRGNIIAEWLNSIFDKKQPLRDRRGRYTNTKDMEKIIYYGDLIQEIARKNKHV